MGYQTNPHVERLWKHLPFEANSRELYEESVDPDDGRPAIATRALNYVRELVRNPETSMVVLTGDAGHGKTHLCRRVIETEYGYEAAAALDLGKAESVGWRAVSGGGGGVGRPLRVIRDLSGIEPASRGAARLAELLADRETVTVVCANEGRLRDAVSNGGRDELRAILETLERSITDGVTSIRPDIHVVNLNWQSVTSPTNSFFGQLLREWADDRRRWAACRSCDAAKRCPILAKQVALGGADTRDSAAVRRRDALEQLVRTVEQSGYVMTIRETLILVAYLVTSTMRCRDVAELDQRGELSGPARDFVWALFERPPRDAERTQLPVLGRFRRLDPGVRALREVDDAVTRALDREDVLAGRGRFEEPPRTLKDERRLAESHRARVRSARRRDFFDGASSGLVTEVDGLAADRAKRLGLRHYAEFAGVFSDAVDQKEVRNRLLDGLHVLQGLRPAPGGLHFFVVDPAFARAEGGAPIIARRFRRSNVRVLPLERTWRSGELLRSVDWTPRRVAIQFEDDPSLLELDMIQFELVARAAGGVVARRFYASESRRLLARLARLAARGRQEESIHVMDGDRLRLIGTDNDQFVVGDP